MAFGIDGQRWFLMIKPVFYATLAKFPPLVLLVG